MNNKVGMNRFAMMMQGRMENVGASPPVLDFGDIMPDFSLKTTYFGIQIPQSDYLICRGLTHDPSKPLTMTWWKDEGIVSGWPNEDWTEKAWGNSDKKTEEEVHPGDTFGIKGEHMESDKLTSIHRHNVYLPKKMRWLQPGDRVLVAWVGNDAVVIDIIIPALEVK